MKKEKLVKICKIEILKLKFSTQNIGMDHSTIDDWTALPIELKADKFQHTNVNEIKLEKFKSRQHNTAFRIELFRIRS